ncbi:ABC transporter ATP-binding protein [Salinicoccus sp. YB14-2]|uniref:ABC transporter ATP-binding protein n=1 Tax=Salinicoccus sp. YB14-2 TaxID=1572701 RepID=UPI00068E09F4|nr:ABC transporter ATP-binding protein [Salinicoccus sp. YB14-2]
MIEIKNVSKSFSDKKILKDISFSIKEGECIGLLGPNGAGKTTLIKCMTDVINFDEGEISFKDKAITNFKDEIGYLSQNTDFKQWMSCEESLKFFGSLSGLSKSYLNNNINKVLEDVGLKEKNDYKVEELSGGMKQRLGIAQAILHRPKFLILDEPVSALDPIGRNEIKKLINQLKEYSTVLISTHILDDASEFCDRFVIIKEGSIIGSINKEDEEINRKRVLFQISNQDINGLVLDSQYPYELNRINQNYYEVISAEEISLSSLMSDFNKHNLDLIDIAFEQKDLEKIFLEMVSDI